ncbi:MAG: NfeD family protein [Parachlamydiaceae bacterium]
MSTYLLLVLGLILIFIEFFIPGAVIGTIGVILVLSSIVSFASTTDSSLALTGYVVSVVIALVYLIKLAIWRMQKTSSKQTICADAAQTGYVASSFDASAIGHRGVVLSDLKPGGYILVEGKKLQAISVSGYISQNATVEVIGGQEESLIVKFIEKETL